MTRGFIKSKKLYGHRNTRSGIVQQLEIIQHKDRPSRLYSFSSEFVAKGQKAKRMLVALYNTYLVVRIATIDYEELKDPRNFASRSQITRRFALYNQTLLLQATSIHYFQPRETLGGFLIFQSCPTLAPSSKTLLHSKSEHLFLVLYQVSIPLPLQLIHNQYFLKRFHLHHHPKPLF